MIKAKQAFFWTFNLETTFWCLLIHSCGPMSQGSWQLIRINVILLASRKRDSVEAKKKSYNWSQKTTALWI